MLGRSAATAEVLTMRISSELIATNAWGSHLALSGLALAQFK